MFRRALLGEHLGSTGLTLHRAGDRELGGLVVVFEDLLVVSGIPLNEHAADNYEVFKIMPIEHFCFDAVRDRFGNGILRRAKHLDRLFRPLDRDLGDHDRGRFDGQIRGQHGEQIAVPLRLRGQRVCERVAHRSGFVTDQQVNMSDFIAITHERFTDVHRHEHVSRLSSKNIFVTDTSVT